MNETDAAPGRSRLLPAARPVHERATALKERIYASFTGLAIVAVLTLEVDHIEAPGALVTLALGILGIASAGFVADVLAHQVTHQAPPTGVELRTMLRIAAGAVASASLPLLSLGAACVGWLELGTALTIGTGVYLATLAMVALVAVGRTSLSTGQRLLALLVMVGFCALVVLVLLVAHLA